MIKGHDHFMAFLPLKMRNIYGLLLFSQLIIGQSLYGQGDGPKAFILMPKRTFMPTKLWIQMHSQTGASDNMAFHEVSFRNSMFIAAFPYTFGIGKHAAQFSLCTGFAKVQYRDKTAGNEVQRRGMIDPVLTFTYGLVNTPALNLRDWMGFSKKFKLWSLFGVSVPLGYYKSSENLNIGINKWSFRLGIPATYEIGKNPKFKGLLEFTPSLILFTNNSKPYVGNNLKQEPLFVTEFHYIQNLGKSFLTSLDFRMQEGGKTFTDGRSDTNRISQYSLGLTVQYALHDKWLFRVSYGYQLFTSSSNAYGYRLGIILVLINKKYKKELNSEKALE